MKFRCFLNPQKIILDRIYEHEIATQKYNDYFQRCNDTDKQWYLQLMLKAEQRCIDRMYKLYAKERKNK